MKILLANSSDRGGGAEKIASDLLRLYQLAGHDAWMAVARKQTADDRVLAIDRDRHRSRWASLCRRCARPLEQPRGSFPPVLLRLGARFLRGMVGEPARTMGWLLGHEDFDFPWTSHLLDMVPSPVNLLHLHNLHDRYFDLRCLSELSRRLPLVITLHDAWLLSGHCCHSFDCERWKTGCGQCPDLTIYHRIPRDATAYNWQRKRGIYAASRLYVATPSRWLMSRVEQSILAPGIKEARVIPNGVNLEVFRPGSQREARTELGLPLDTRIILFAAYKIRRNQFKDFPTLRSALVRVGALCPGDKVCCLAVGESGKPEAIPGVDFRFVPFQPDESRMAKYYQAADIYVHAARADTFPGTILEASACGIPVVASRVGGIVEQVEDGKTGFLVPVGDAEAMALRVTQLLRDAPMRAEMSRLGAEMIQQRFGLKRMVSDYLDWFQEIVRSWRSL